MGGYLTSVVTEIVRRLLIEGRHACAHIPATVFHALRCGRIPVKDRHVYTRAGRLRLRYVALMAAAFLGLASSNLSFTSQDGFDIAQAQASVAPLQSIAAIEPAAGIDAAAPVQAAVQDAAPTADMQLAAVAPQAPAKPKTMPSSYTRTLTVKAGDTLSDLMEHAAISQVSDAVAALKGHINPKELKAGQDVTMHYSWSSAAGERLAAMEFAPTPLTRVVLRQASGGAFKVEKIERDLKPETRAARATIRTSLYADLRAAGVPDSIIGEFIKAYSYNVDFQRDIWAGDRVELLYSVNRTDNGDFVRGEHLTYAALHLRGKANIIFRFEHEGTVEFFDDKGNPVRKALLKTPVDGARVTSGFGMRRHPIQGYNKMHKGMDFGAPTGTPIFAAGDGVVGRAGWFSGYGKYVSIKHNGTYTTAYAHMSQISVKPGQRVKQGQVIGRVGSTGNSTGPHLHFEVLKAGTQVNPAKVANLSVGTKLAGKQMARFRATVASARQNFETLVGAAATPKLASAGSR